MKNNIITDFRKFYKDRFPFHMMSFDQIMKSTGNNYPTGGYISPTILEEREMHVTQMDVFSRLMVDRQIFFGTDVSSEAANVIVGQLLYLDSVNKNDITIYVNSPGGSVYAGFGILDTMNFIDSKVSTVCTGLAASMGAMILMCGARGKRKMLEHSRCMIHQPLGGVDGQATDIEITAKEILKLKDELIGLIAQRSGQPIEKVREDCERDHWLTSQETLEYGLIDEVIKKDLD